MKLIIGLLIAVAGFAQTPLPGSASGGGGGSAPVGANNDVLCYQSAIPTACKTGAFTVDPTTGSVSIQTTLPGGAPSGSLAALGNIYAGGVQLNSPVALAGLWTGSCTSAPCPLGSDGTLLNYSSAFSAVTAGTNTAALAVGAGGSLDIASTGTINATSVGHALQNSYTAPAYTCNSTFVLCFVDTTSSSNSTDLCFGCDGSSTYSAGHISANVFQAWFVAGVGQTSDNVPMIQVKNRSGSQGLAIGQSGTIQTTGLILNQGTKFTISGCSAGTTVGGATAGTFLSGTTGACTVVITLNNGLAATNGWTCAAADLTTPANLISQSASSTSTCTVTGTTVSGDKISFLAIGF